MATALRELVIERDVPIETWYRVGGSAKRLVRPASLDDVRRCLEMDPELRVLGDGANLLVADEGVEELVLAFTEPAMRAVRFEDGPNGPGSRVIAMAGANLPKLINETVRRGLGGLEGLAGVPASVGGAAVMNAGGTFGQIADVIACVRGVDRRGREVELRRSQIGFGYRQSGLNHLVIASVEMDLRPGDAAALRKRQKEVMAYKAASQPMAAQSAGCCFRNPTVDQELALSQGWVKQRSNSELPEGSEEPRECCSGQNSNPASPLGRSGSSGDSEFPSCRVSAGMLIDRAGCKGLRIGTAHVSTGHANFLLADSGGRAGDVIALMAEVQRRVLHTFGVALEPEVVVWGAQRQPAA